jgi:serine/threonine-protein kinase SRPK3
MQRSALVPHLKRTGHLIPTGSWVSGPPIPEPSLEDFVTTIPPAKEKEMFLRFVQKILTWDPEARARALELIHDKWLMTPNEDLM